MDTYCPSEYWPDFYGPIIDDWKECHICGNDFYLPDAKDPKLEQCNYCLAQRC